MHHRHHHTATARQGASRSDTSHSDASAPAHAGHKHAALQTDGATIRWATFYDALVKVILLGDERRLRTSTVALAALRPGEQVLEVGCGTGSLAIAAALQASPGLKVHGTDPAPEMIARARRKAAEAGAGVDFREGLVERIDFPDATFDVVLSSFMLHHLPDHLKRPAFAEIRRVLKPGGRVLVVDFEPPQGRFLRAVLTVMVGRGMMRIDNRYLPELLRTSGFTAVQTGRTDHPLASYASARKEA